MKETLNPEMVTIARESRGLTQSELAKQLTITQGALSKIEGGLKAASPDILAKLSEILGYPEKFFFSREPVFGLGIGTLYHRKRQSLSSIVLAKIHAQINILRIHIGRLLAAIDLEPAKIERLDPDEHETPEQIARIVRARWLIKSGPVHNLTGAIEDAGGIVVRCDFGTPLIDAISQWPPDLPPLFFVNEVLPGDRLRFSLAHELGHIIMHEHHRDDMEGEANRFAAEFLMPASDIRPSLSPLALPILATLKSYWKVSMAAILKRATDLKTISERQARYLWMCIGQAGYRKREPAELDIPVEKPTGLDDLIATYRNDLGYSIADLSAFLDIHEHQFRSDYLGQRGGLRMIQGGVVRRMGLA